MTRTWHRWLPAGAVAAIIAGTVAVTSQAGAVDLPDRSPEDVLAMVGHHSVTAFSGSFEKSADLGLPELPAGLAGAGGFGGGPPGGAGLGDDAGDDDALPADPDQSTPATEPPEATPAAELLELLTGDHTGRVFVGGPDEARFQLVDGLAERNVVVNGTDVWAYDSATNTATHVTLPDPADLPAPPERPGHPERPGAADLPTPEELAAAVVDALEPSTELSVGQDARVAGRDAYTLVLTPRAAETLVASVTIAVDGETGFPLGVTVMADGQTDPAFRLAYTDIDLAAPDASLFDFAPPADATVEAYDVPVPDPADWPDHGAAGPGTDRALPPELDGPGQAGALGELPGPAVLGEGWGTVVVLDAGPDATALTEEPLLAELTEPVDGGRLLSTALLSALVTDDGRILVGAVTPEHLQALADS